jgi:phage-related baseplate assembly protein
MAVLPEPIFFETDGDAIIAESTAFYEALVGKQLAPSQTEQLLINAFAYREKMYRIAGNEAAKQNLLSFAAYPMLDYLGELFDVTRLPAGQALCNLVFSMVASNPSLIIPAGTRVQSTDGKVVFLTLADLIVNTSTSTASVTAECTVEGAIGNNYQVGAISVILDPVAFVNSCSNSDITNSGSDQETDDALRERIRLAPSTFSTAGPEEAYIYFAKSADPTIIDVAITSPNPGDVNIYPLIVGGTAPSSEIIAKVLAACNAEKVRPLSDNVTVAAPTVVNYTIEVNLTNLTDAIDDEVVTQVTANLNAYALARKTKLGIDVIISQIIGKSMAEGVYECAVVHPAADITVALDHYANCTAVTVNVIGSSVA